jgi:hypothetical protein
MKTACRYSIGCATGAMTGLSPIAGFYCAPCHRAETIERREDWYDR